MTKACKRRMLRRLNAVWTLSKFRPVDVEEKEDGLLTVTYRHAETGELSVSELYVDEVERQEANMRA